MISDVLSDASDEIERYEREMPECYAGLSDELGRVRTLMDAMRVYLDLPQWADPLRDALLVAIGGVDVGPVRAALDAIFDRANPDRPTEGDG